MSKKCQLSQCNLTDFDHMDMGQPGTSNLGPLNDPLPQLEEIRLPGVPSSTPDQPPDFIPVMEDLLITNNFIQCLKDASLGDKYDNIDAEMLHQIRHPFETPVTLDNPDDRLSIDIYLSVTNASEATYNSVKDAILH